MSKPLHKSMPSERETTASALRPVEMSIAAYDRWLSWGVFVLVWVLYGITLGFQFTFDDDVYTKVNKSVAQLRWGEIFTKGSVYGFTGENSGIYRPVTLATFGLEKAILGDFNPQVGHFVNVLLYALGMWLLYKLLRRLWGGTHFSLALCVVLLFLLHPIHTDVVCNIKSRDELLAFLFTLSAWWFFIRWVEEKKNGWIMLGLLSYLLGCFSKENALTYVVILPLSLWMFKGYGVVEAVKKGLPWLGVALFYVGIRSLFLEASPQVAQEIMVMNNSVYAATSFSDRLASQFLVLGKYFQLLVFPHPLSYDYSVGQLPIVGWKDYRAYGSLLLYAGLLTYALWGIFRKQLAAFGGLYFLLTFSITANLFVFIACTLGERFLFIPSLGFCIGLGGVFIHKISSPSVGRLKAMWGVTAILCVAYLWKDIERIPQWESNDTLFESGVHTAPNSYRTHYNLAEITRTKAEVEKDTQQKQLLSQKALHHYRRSLEIYPKQTNTWYNMGVLEYGLGKMESALNYFKNELNRNPRHPKALNNAGVVHFQRGEMEQAVYYFTKAVTENPQGIDAIGNLAAAYQNMGRLPEAAQQYEKLLAFNGISTTVLENALKAFTALGMNDKMAIVQRRLGR